MTTRTYWICIIAALGSVWLPPTDGYAQDVADAGAAADAEPKAEPASEADAGTEAGTEADAGVDDKPVEAASDAERIMRIRRVIELDSERLRWLRIELKSRTDWFEGLVEAMTELTKELNEKKEEAEALEEDDDSEEAEALRTRVAELQEDYELYDRQTDLALRAEKKTKEQIEALGDKIAKEERALGELTGEIPIEAPEEPAPTPTPVTEPAETEPRPPALPLPVPLPQPPAQPETKGPSAMTAAQLQAHKVLEQKEHKARLAELAVEEFVERKRALEKQIEFEESLGETEAKELENLNRAAEAFEKRLNTAIEADAAPEKIKRLKRSVKNIKRFMEEERRATERRGEYIESLYERHKLLEEEELRVTAIADEKEKAVRDARRRIVWLESPIHPMNIAHWARERGPRMLLVVVAVAFLLILLQVSARRVARALVGRRRGARSVGTGRADTLAFSFRSASRVIIVVLGVLLVLQEAGIDIKTVLGGAAILGIAIAFGAQDMMKDYFSGFLILLEDQYQLGDLISIGAVTGTVESVNMRVTVLRDLEGRVHFIPNGEIDAVTNRTYGWGRPVFEIPVSYDEDVERVMATLVDVAKELGKDPDWENFVIGDPDMLGVDKFSEYGVIIKFMVKTQPDKLFEVRRELLRRIKNRFDKEGIQISVPHRLVLHPRSDSE